MEVDEGEESEEFLDCEVPEESLLTDAHRGNKFYAEVTFKGMKIKLGDFVKVSLEESCAGQSSTSVCQVLALYDDVEGGSGIFMEARWFQTVAELSEKSRRMYVQLMMCHIFIIFGIVQAYFVFLFSFIFLSCVLPLALLKLNVSLIELYDIHVSLVLPSHSSRSI
jgi:hypothetical protein